MAKTPWLIVLCKVRGHTDTSAFSLTDLNRMFLGQEGLSDYWRDVSRQRIDIRDSQIRGWYSMNLSESDLKGVGGRRERIQACIDEVVRIDKQDGTVTDYTRFSGVIIFLNVHIGEQDAMPGPYKFGAQVVPYHGIMVPPGLMVHGYLAHEMGHGFGLKHGRHERDPVQAYLDPWGIMSYNDCHSKTEAFFGKVGPGVTAPDLVCNGWLEPSATWTLGVDKPNPGGTVSLKALNARASEAISGIHVIRAGDYTVEFRHPSSWDAGLPRAGVVIHRIVDGRGYLVSGVPDLQESWSYSDRVQDLIIGVDAIPMDQTGTLAGGSAGPAREAWVFVRRIGQRGWAHCAHCGVLYFSQFGAGACPARSGGHASPQPQRYAVVRAEPTDAGQPGWCYCRNCNGLVYQGGGVCPHRTDGGAHDVEGNGGYTMLESTRAPGEHGWRWCHKCNGIFRLSTDKMASAAAAPSKCPKDGGRHSDQPSGKYVMNLVQEPPTLQNDWWFCQKCGCLYYDADGKPNGGVCFDGAPHDNQASGAYGVLHGGAMSGGEYGWKWCRNCSGLYFPGTVDSPGSGKRCRGDQPHDFYGSGDYVLSKESTAVGQKGWSRCGRCDALFFTGPAKPVYCREEGGKPVPHVPTDMYTAMQSRPIERDWRYCRICKTLHYGGRKGGMCLGGRPHDASLSGDYVLYRNTRWIQGQNEWRVCLHCESLFYASGGRRGRCYSDSAGHLARDNNDYRLLGKNSKGVLDQDITQIAPFEAQDGWRWCTKCDGLFYNPHAADSHCPAGDTHTALAGSEDYFLCTDPAPAP